MDNLSSADLDSSSKTPIFVGIAAVILALVSLALGWMAFSKNKELESQIAQLVAAQSDPAEYQGKLDASKNELNGLVNNMAKQVSSKFNELDQKVDAVGADVSKNKRDLRSITIQAGTALKKVEALEKNGIKVTTTTRNPSSSQAAAPKPSSTASQASSGIKPSSSSGGGNPEVKSYAVQSGDTLAGIAGKFKISLNALLGANPGVDPYRLQIGQKLLIPGAK